MKCVVIGGGHGAAVSAKAAQIAGFETTAVVSVADNGGSSGRLREAFDIPALGDLRKCLGSLATGSSPLKTLMEHRFDRGEFEGHSLGNLLLMAALSHYGDLTMACEAVGEMLEIAGSVVPASSEVVDLMGFTDVTTVRGQVEIAATTNLRSVATDPIAVSASLGSLTAIESSELIVLGPGSFFTSVLAACVVPGISQSLASSIGKIVFVANTDDSEIENRNLSVARQLEILADHGVFPDLVMFAEDGSLELGDTEVPVLSAVLTDSHQKSHSSELLARALLQIVT